MGTLLVCMGCMVKPSMLHAAQAARMGARGSRRLRLRCIEIPCMHARTHARTHRACPQFTGGTPPLASLLSQHSESRLAGGGGLQHAAHRTPLARVPSQRQQCCTALHSDSNITVCQSTTALHGASRPCHVAHLISPVFVTACYVGVFTAAASNNPPAARYRDSSNNLCGPSTAECTQLYCSVGTTGTAPNNQPQPKQQAFAQVRAGRCLRLLVQGAFLGRRMHARRCNGGACAC